MDTGKVASALAICIAVASTQPAPAHACSCLAQVLSQTGDPADGATDVPLNKAPIIVGMFVPDSVVLEDEAGQSVAFTLNAGPTSGPCGPNNWADLIPKQPLQPNTKYTIRVEPLPSIGRQTLPNTVTFTTGADMLDDEQVTTPVGRASTLLHVRDGFDCGPSNAMTCTDVSPRKNIEVIARRGSRVLMRTVYPSLDEGMFGFDETPDCIEFRHRSATGKRSAPLILCGDALPTREFRDSDLDGPTVMCKGGVIGNSGTGKADGGKNTPKDPPTTVAADAGPKSDPDVNAEPKWPHEGAAGSRAPASNSDSNAPPASDEAKHRTYGCSAAPAGSLTTPWIIFALALAAYVIRRGARSRES